MNSYIALAVPDLDNISSLGSNRKIKWATLYTHMYHYMEVYTCMEFVSVIDLYVKICMVVQF